MEKGIGDKMAKLFRDNFSMSKIVLIFLKMIFFEEYWIIRTNLVLTFLDNFTFWTTLFCKNGPNFYLGIPKKFFKS